MCAYVHGAHPSAVTRPQMCAVKVPGDVLSTAAFLHARDF